MSAPWYPQPSLAWELTVEMLTKRGGAWEVPFMVADLRWWSNQVRLKKAKRIPGSRFFLKRWNCTQHAARSVMSDPETWSDGISQQNPPKKTTAARLPPASHPLAARSDEGKPAEPADIHPLAARQSPADRHTHVGEEQEPRTNTLLLQMPDEPPAKAAPLITPEVHKAHEAFRRTHVTSYQPLKASKGEGLNIAALVKEHGAELVASVYRWAATSDHDKAKLMRGQLANGKGGFYSSRPAKWLRVSKGEHWDELVDAMNAKQSATPHNGSNGPASATPGHLFLRAYESARGRHPAWLDYVPSDERNRFEEASRKCSGLTMARTMGSHNLDRKRVIETFNQAFEAAR